VSVRLLDARLRGALVEARVPFRFGIAEMKEIVHVLLFVTAEIDGRRQTGVAADNLPPKWFTKNPGTSYRADVVGMIDVIEAACTVALESGRHDSVFDLWQRVYRECVSGDTEVVPLLAGFGVSVVERAVIDAFCRAEHVPFAEAVRSNRLGIRLGSLHPELAERGPREFLPRRPLTSLTVRHTVGLSDPLRTGDDLGVVAPDELPSTLEGWIRRCGLRRFKVKVGGNPRADMDRLEQVCEVLDDETGGDYRVTIDGNEQFAGVPVLRELWEKVTSSEIGRHVDYVEQPFPRGITLSAETAAALARWQGRPRLIIDESDDSLDAVARAIEAGYAGGAFKSSKGVFKGIGNACRIEQRRRDDPGVRLVYSAEDLSTIGPVGLLADLAAIATLGIDEPERNGYHYFRGFAGLPARAEEETIRNHADLFSRDADGRAELRVEGGRVSLGSVVAAPFGVGWRCDIEEELDGVDSLVAAIP
jgi:hypothetical protein